MSYRGKDKIERLKLIGTLMSNCWPSQLKKEQEKKILAEAKTIILGLKRIFEELNLSESEIKKLFQECDLNFWESEKSGMEKMLEELGLQGCFISGDPIDISDESLAVLRAQIDENVRQNEEAALNEDVAMLKKGPSIY